MHGRVKVVIEVDGWEELVRIWVKHWGLEIVVVRWRQHLFVIFLVMIMKVVIFLLMVGLLINLLQSWLEARPWWYY